MNILGYSERGVLNSLFYEIGYSPQAENLLETLLSCARFPFLDWRPPSVESAEILIEQSFSDFGDADAVLLINTGQQAISVFVEAKVKSYQRSRWSIDEEFATFMAGTRSRVRSSNLFTQLYHKLRLLESLRQGGSTLLQAGVGFPQSSSKRSRKIGNNGVVLQAVSRLEKHLDASYYLALVPDDQAKVAAFFDGVLRRERPQDYPDWDVSHFGYVTWAQVEAFCREQSLQNTQQVFAFNEGQIYD